MTGPVRDRAEELETRIRRLSDSQRRALAARLSELNGNRGGRRSEGVTLAAFVTVDRDSAGLAPTSAELRGHMQGVVPGHMVPSIIRVLDEIPRLPNGKLDAAALAALAEEAVDPEPDWTPPRNEVERKLAAIWCEVLQVDSVGVHDPFFELGGDSILSIHVTSRANQQGLALFPNDIFNFPTIALLAARCAERTETSDGHRIPSPDPTPVDGVGRKPLFMVHWGNDEADPLRRHLGREQPVFSFRGHWHGTYLGRDATVERMAEENVAELRSLQPSGPYFIGGYSMGAPIALEMAQQLRRQGERVSMLFVLDPPSLGRSRNASFRRAPRTLAQKLSSHVQALSSLRPAGWSEYLARETAAQLRHRVWQPLKLVTIGALSRIGIKVPAALWRQYVGAVYLRARNRYRLASYDGDVIVFGGSGEGSVERLDSWRDVILGDFHVETFEGGHLDFTKDPELFDRWVRRLATVLADRRLDTLDGSTDQPSDRTGTRSVRRTTEDVPSAASAAR